MPKTRVFQTQNFSCSTTFPFRDITEKVLRSSTIQLYRHLFDPACLISVSVSASVSLILVFLVMFQPALASHSSPPFHLFLNFRHYHHLRFSHLRLSISILIPVSVSAPLISVSPCLRLCFSYLCDSMSPSPFISFPCLRTRISHLRISKSSSPPPFLSSPCLRLRFSSPCLRLRFPHLRVSISASPTPSPSPFLSSRLGVSVCQPPAAVRLAPAAPHASHWPHTGWR